MVLLIFAVGYLAMARRITNAGAFYAYAAQSLGRPFGVGVALVALVTYNCFQVASYGGVGAIAAPMFSHWFGIEVQWWVLGLLGWLIVGAYWASSTSASARRSWRCWSSARPWPCWST